MPIATHEYKHIYGYDFVKYDRKSVTRRIEALMLKLGITSLPLLAKEVLLHKSLFEELLLSISINVTEFFRKPSLYVAMRKLLISNFVHNHPKIWVAGSSTGEEPYSIAMLLAQLGLYEQALICARTLKQHAFMLKVTPMESEDEYIVTFTDITHLMHESQELEQKAFHDTLTGLFNREKLQEFIDYEIDTAIDDSF